MLVLSRRVGQSLLIGDNIEIIVTKFHEGRVSLGIKAPREINVRRGELLPPTEPSSTDEGIQECSPKNSN